MTAAAPANRWPWFAAIVLSLVAIADGGIVAAARVVRPTAVEDRPWLASARIDAGKAARSRFAASGLTLVASPAAAGRIACSLLPSGSGIGSGTLVCYRPDDPRLDRRVAWADTREALPIDGLRAGRWRITLVDAAGAAVAEVGAEASAEAAR